MVLGCFLRTESVITSALPKVKTARLLSLQDPVPPVLYPNRERCDHEYASLSHELSSLPKGAVNEDAGAWFSGVGTTADYDMN